MGYGGSYLHFLNIQYWYCYFYSLFGGYCRAIDGPRIDGSLDVGVIGSASSTVSTSGSTGFWGALVDGASWIWGFAGSFVWFVWSLFSVVALTYSGLVFLVILGTLVGFFLLRFRELSVYGNLAPIKNGAHAKQDVWATLLEDAMSTDPKRWRRAILEADVMLGAVLGKLGYEGATTPEKMRSVPDGAFVMLPVAWEAHRIRNFVSARSSDFILTQREAFRVMKLYEEVFEELGFN